MILTELTSVSAGVLPVDQLKAQLRLGTGFSDSDIQDDLLETYLRTAILMVEARSGRVLLQKQYSWQLTRWRDAARQVLPVRPLVGVDDIKLVDIAGAEVVADVTDYKVVQDDICPAIEATGTALPNVPIGGTVDIIFEAGFGAVWADIPSDLAQAVLIIAAHAYENRTGDAGAIPMAAQSLMEPYRALRLLRGL